MKTAISLITAALMCASASSFAGVCNVDRQLCQERNEVRKELKIIFAAAQDGVLTVAQYNALVAKSQQAQRIAADLREMGFGRGFTRRYAERSQQLLARARQQGENQLVIEVPLLINE